jgi:hypothetical protein
VDVIKVAVLGTLGLRPRDLSKILDAAFADQDEILQFVVDGHGWHDNGAVESALWTALIDDTADRLTE